MSHAKIMQKYGVSRGTFDSWLKHPAFAGELRAMQDDLVRSLAVDGVRYVTKQDRIRALSQKAESAGAQYDAHPWLREVRPLPPRSVVRIKSRGTDGAESVEETEPLDAIVNESFNRDAFSEFRAALADIAAELGARKPDKSDSSDAHTFRLIIETDNDGHAHVSNGSD